VGEQSTEVIRPTTQTTRSARPCMVPPSPTVNHAGTDALTTVDPPPTLLLDPNPDAAAVMASQLRHAGFETHIATSGSSALLAIRTLRFGAIVVVADLANTAIRNNLRAIRRAAQDSWLVLIADSMIDPADEFLHELGSDAVFAAPFTVADLTQRLNTLSNRRRSLR
jgi:DNA-binding response OmpR family regulator